MIVCVCVTGVCMYGGNVLFYHGCCLKAGVSKNLWQSHRCKKFSLFNNWIFYSWKKKDRETTAVTLATSCNQSAGKCFCFTCPNINVCFMHLPELTLDSLIRYHHSCFSFLALCSLHLRIRRSAWGPERNILKWNLLTLQPVALIIVRKISCEFVSVWVFYHLCSSIIPHYVKYTRLPVS